MSKVLRYKQHRVCWRISESVCVHKDGCAWDSATATHFTKAWEHLKIKKKLISINYASHHDVDQFLTRLSSAKAICHFKEANYWFLTWNSLHLFHERHLNVTTSVGKTRLENIQIHQCFQKKKNWTYSQTPKKFLTTIFYFCLRFPEQIIPDISTVLAVLWSQRIPDTSSKWWYTQPDAKLMHNAL